MAKETKKYDEDYLNGLIKKAKKSWEGVDVDSFMSDLRDDLSDKEVAKKEREAIENFRKAIMVTLGTEQRYIKGINPI